MGYSFILNYVPLPQCPWGGKVGEVDLDNDSPHLGAETSQPWSTALQTQSSSHSLIFIYYTMSAVYDSWAACIISLTWKNTTAASPLSAFGRVALWNKVKLINLIPSAWELRDQNISMRVRSCRPSNPKPRINENTRKLKRSNLGWAFHKWKMNLSVQHLHMGVIIF